MERMKGKGRKGKDMKEEKGPQCTEGNEKGGIEG